MSTENINYSNLDARYTQPADISAGVLGQAPLAASVRHARPPRPVKNFISTFQTGHGWTLLSGTGSAADSTTSPGLGTSSVLITTNGTGDNSNRLVYASPTLGSTVDMSRYDVAMLLKVDDLTKVNYIRLRYGAGGDVMTNYYYADFGVSYTTAGTQDGAAGVWQWQQTATAGVTAIGTPTGTAAINRFAITTTDKGTGAMTIHVAALALVPKNTGLYPHGVIVIWFDDGYYDASTTGAQILDKYGFPAVQSPIWDQIVPTYAGGQYAGLDTLHTLHDIKGWDIVGHATTIAIHSGSGGNGLDDLTVPQLHQEFQTLRQTLISNGFERGSDVLAYPLGFHSAQTVSVARQYWTWARTTMSSNTNIGIEGLPPGNALAVKTNSLDTRSLSTFTNVIDQLYAGGGLGIFYTHRVNASPSGTQISTANFQSFVDYIAAKGVPVRTISDVISSLSASEMELIKGGTP